jgi:replicative DNA helicase
MGKTSFAMQCAIHAATQGDPVLFFSLEMSGVQLTQRVIAQMAGVSVQSLRTGKLTDRDLEDVRNVTESLQSLPVYIDDTPAISLSALRSKARKAVLSKGIKLIVIDYIQLMTTTVEKGATRERYLSDISAGLKALCKELNVPIIPLAQLSRAVEARSDKRPQLSDLRESGSLEQDADAVVFLYRPEYYGVTADESGASTAGQCEVIFGKHRNGAVGTCDENVGFQGDCTRFYNLNETQYMVKPQEAQATSFTIQRPTVTDEIPF